MKIKNLNSKQGFTLIELLVVIVIIGILAGIALPQYKQAVLKSKYSNLKTQVKAIAQAREDYYLIHNIYPCYFDELIIEPGFTCYQGNHSADCYQKKKTEYPNIRLSLNCQAIQTVGIIQFGLSKNWLGYVYNHAPKNFYCIDYSDSGKYTKLCQQETGKMSSPYIY